MTKPSFKRSHILLYSLALLAVLVTAGVLFGRPILAGLDWEIQRPPERFQASQPGADVDLNAVEFHYNSAAQKYYGWAVGDIYNEGTPAEPLRDTILYYNGSIWNTFEQAELKQTPQNLNDVAVAWDSANSKYRIWAVGQNDRFWFYPDGANLCTPPPLEPNFCNGPTTGANLNAVAAYVDLSTNDTHVFVAAGDNKIYKNRYNANFASSNNWGENPLGTAGAPQDIFILDADHLYAVDNLGWIYQGVGATSNFWAAWQNFTGTFFTGITAADSEHIWAVGRKIATNKGAIYFSDGLTWTEVTPFNDLPPLNGVSAYKDPATGMINAFAVGELEDPALGGNGVILQYNGQAWERQDSNDGGKVLTGVSAASLTQIRAVGEDATILVSTPGNIFGWLWFGQSTDGNQDSLGWLSGSCANQGLCEEAGFTYGISIKRSGPEAGAVSGYGWAGSADWAAYKVGDCVGGFCDSAGGTLACANDSACNCANNSAACQSTGWLSFNKFGPDGVTPEAGAPPAEPFGALDPQKYIAKYDQLTGKVSGWARLLSLKDVETDGGWIKLRGTDVTASLGPTDWPISDCKNCDKFCSNDPTKRCKLNQDCGAGNSCNVKECKVCNQLESAYGTDERVSGNRCSGDIIPGAHTQACTRRCSGDHSIECTGAIGDCSGLGSCLDELFCNSCETVDNYGVSIDDATGKITGFGWSGGNNAIGELGWLDFSRANYYSQAWLQTVQGDIYARGNIGSANTPSPPQGTAGQKCNATYILSAAGTITNFCTELGEADPGRPYFQQNYDSVYFPGGGNSYTNALGRLDVTGTITKTSGDNNRYGNQVIEFEVPGEPQHTFTLEEIGLCQPLVGPLDDKVYYIKGSLNIAPCGGGMVTELKIDNGAGPDKGSGTIVVQNNLIIEMDLSYEDAAGIANISQLASLGVIVQTGRVIVRDSVSSIVGSYINFGAPDTPNAASFEIENSVQESPFTAQGLLIARSFKFGRTFRGTLIDPQPAEQISYDGRVVANPPPGFKDFVKVLPQIREIGSF